MAASLFIGAQELWQDMLYRISEICIHFSWNKAFEIVYNAWK